MAAVFATNSGAPQLNSAVVGWGGKVQRGSAVHSQRGEEARQWGTGLGPDLVGTHRRKIIRGVPLCKEAGGKGQRQVGVRCRVSEAWLHSGVRENRVGLEGLKVNEVYSRQRRACGMGRPAKEAWARGAEGKVEPNRNHPQRGKWRD